MTAESTCFPGNTIHQGKENGKSDKGGNPERGSLRSNKHKLKGGAFCVYP